MGVLVTGQYFNNAYYVATSGNNANAGTDPGSPKAAMRNGTTGALDVATAGDVVIVAPGTYTSAADANRNIIPDGVAVIGAGRGLTVFNVTANNVCTINEGGLVSFGGSGLIRGVTIDASATGAGNAIGMTYRTGSIESPAASGNVTIQDVEILARFDGLLISFGSAVNFRIFDSQIRCLFDALAIGTDGIGSGAINVLAQRCLLEGAGPLSGSRACGVSIQVGAPRTTLRDCSIRGSGSSTTTTGNGNYGVQTLAAAGAAVTRIDNCDVRAEPHATSAVQYRAFDNLSTSAKMYVHGGTFDGPVNGDVAIVPSIARTGFFPHA